MHRFRGARRPRALALLIASALAAAPPLAHAAPDEIEVYDGEHQPAGGAALELHNNYVAEGERAAPHPRGQAPAHAYRLTPELAYGVSDHLEAGLLALGSVDRHGTAAVAGVKARLRWLDAPPARAWWWGANIEVGRVGRRFEPSPWTAEVGGIWGMEAGRWTLALNPIVEWDLRGEEPASLALASKLGYRLVERLSLGVESYNELGPARRPLRLAEESQMLYGVADVTLGRVGLNLGVGRGLSGPADRWVLKAVIEVPLGR